MPHRLGRKRGLPPRVVEHATTNSMMIRGNSALDSISYLTYLQSLWIAAHLHNRLETNGGRRSKPPTERQYTIVFGWFVNPLDRISPIKFGFH